MRAGFVIPLFVTYQFYPAMNISYLPLPICSGNFNRFTSIAIKLIALQEVFNATLHRFNTFELRFVVRVLLHHRLRFNHLPQSR